MRMHLWMLAGLAGTFAAPTADAASSPQGVRSPAATADTATVGYEVAGLRVIHRPLDANQIVAVNLYFLGGAQQIDAATAGIEAMLLRTSEFGTERYPGREARLALARTGSRTVLYTEPDWSVLGFRGLVSEFDSTWSVLADRVMRPTLDSAAVEVVRRRMLRARRSQRNHPDAMLRLLADSVVFAGHPYQHSPEGSEASLSEITLEALRAYHRSQIVTSRMLLVVVGNVSRARLEAAIQRTLGQLPPGDHVWSLPPEWPAPRASVTALQRQLPTNYILGYFAGPRSDSEDYAPFTMATRILGGLANYEIRENGLSYAAYSPVLKRGASGGGIYVTTTRPDTTIKIFNSAIEHLQNGRTNRSTLQRYFDGFVTNYYGENESNAGQADFLARHELLHGDWRRAGSYMADLKRVQGYQIRAAARRYIRNIQYVYIGNLQRMPQRELTKF
jgi:zinc protease